MHLNVVTADDVEALPRVSSGNNPVVPLCSFLVGLWRLRLTGPLSGVIDSIWFRRVS